MTYASSESLDRQADSAAEAVAIDNLRRALGVGEDWSLTVESGWQRKTMAVQRQLTSAEVIAELIELAKDVVADADRGQQFTPPMDHDELVFYDLVSSNESAVDLMGDDVLAQIARELVQVMRRDVRTDWTVRDDVRARLRSSIKRLLVRHRWPPDEQPGAIKQVMERMEAMAPRYAEERRSH